MPTITPIQAFKDNYIWMIADDRHAVVVDPGDAAPVLATLAAQRLDLTGILITHHHWDHTGGVEELLQHFAVPVFASAHESVAGVTHPVSENDTVLLPYVQTKLHVLDIPCHTRGHIAYYGDGIVFTGDTLFTAGCGRLFEGTAEQMYNSLGKLAALPTNTLVYCGHEYTEANLHFAQAVEPNNTDIAKRLQQVQKLRIANQPTVPATLAEEKLTNPFLRCEVPAVIVAAEQHAKRKLTTPVEVFACLREWKNDF